MAILGGVLALVTVAVMLQSKYAPSHLIHTSNQAYITSVVPLGLIGLMLHSCRLCLHDSVMQHSVKKLSDPWHASTSINTSTTCGSKLVTSDSEVFL